MSDPANQGPGPEQSRSSSADADQLDMLSGRLLSGWLPAAGPTDPPERSESLPYPDSSNDSAAPVLPSEGGSTSVAGRPSIGPGASAALDQFEQLAYSRSRPMPPVPGSMASATAARALSTTDLQPAPGPAEQPVLDRPTGEDDPVDRGPSSTQPHAVPRALLGLEPPRQAAHRGCFGGTQEDAKPDDSTHAPQVPRPLPGLLAGAHFETPPPPEGVIEFTEPGRQHLTENPEHGDRLAVPAHLDPRIHGLHSEEAGKRRLSLRRRPDPCADNPPADSLTATIDTPRRISVVGMKGGVGKTTLSVLMATTAARRRRHPVLLLDSDVTYGSLALRTGIVPIASAHDIARMGDPGSLEMLGTSVSRTADGVWILPSGRSPEQSANFTDRTYVEAVRAVYRHFPLTITDCGAGMAGALMERVISASHALVIATTPSMDGILASHNALQWLSSLGYQSLLSRTIVAMTNVAPKRTSIDLTEARRRFAGYCRSVVVVPADPHLQPGSEVRYDALASATQSAIDSLTSDAIAAAISVP